jgi:hypothetical protein
MDTVIIDFEFYNSKEEQMEIVCVAVKKKYERGYFWLHKDDAAKQRFRNYVHANKDKVFIAFNATAEARSFLSLGLNPLDYKWIDARFEYMNLMNCNNWYQFGQNMINGKITVTTPKTKTWGDEETEDESGNHAQAESSLVSFVYKFCDKNIGADHKDDMRDLILSGGPYNAGEQKAILTYCASDVTNLEMAWDRCLPKLKKFQVRDKDMLVRGRTACLTAIMETNGYPIDIEKVKNFQANLPHAKAKICEDINSQFDSPLFRWQRKTERYKLETKVIQEHVKINFEKDWPKTPSGKYKTDEKTINKFCDDKYDYKRGNVLSQFKRYASFNSSTKSLEAGSGDRNLLTACGKDNRIRAWLNPYGSQTSRFQPKAKEFLFLKSAWMRSLCLPEKGKVIIGIDFASQEFLLQGCVSGDEEVFKSYMSGDVYVDFGQKVGIVPTDYDKSKHKIERSVAKTAVLGIGYGMGPNKLALSITQAAKPTTEEEAVQIIKKYYDLYKVYAAYKDQVIRDYRSKKRLKLPDGWTLWGDNDNTKSILNFPIQGVGACILRKSIELAIGSGLKVIMPLHDALYVECDLKDLEESADTLAECMKQASGFYFDGEPKKWAESIRLDCEVWGPELNNSKSITKKGLQYTTSDLYRDERGAEEYEHFKQFFEPITDFEIARTV